MNKTVEKLHSLSRNSLITISLVIVLIIGALDFLVGPNVGFSLFYIIPIYLIAWFVGRYAGIFLSFTSASMWLITSELIPTKFHSNSFIPYWNALVRLGFFVIVVLLVTALKGAQSRANIDPLTLVGNRRYFFELVETEIQKLLRYKRPFTAAYIDIDDFKAVNDNMGHDAGDDLLKAVAQTVKNNIRSVDIFARLGGDEFVLLLTETSSVSARNIILKIHKLLMMLSKTNNWPVTFSIGVLTFNSPPDSVHDLIKKVDSVMYAAKKSGKNSIKYDIHGDWMI